MGWDCCSREDHAGHHCSWGEEVAVDHTCSRGRAAGFSLKVSTVAHFLVWFVSGKGTNQIDLKLGCTSPFSGQYYNLPCKTSPCPKGAIRIRELEPARSRAGS